ncbi:MAG: phage tail sheath subtilisin-like domain-containing protein [Flavobacteriaceae bacterium]|nr:phage tail sheath subtilisin-like domain-containing protein [Flavobacteriaceae bacterium]
MSTQLKTPGVYIEEISKLPPSVAQVETAIPAFVGYTEKTVGKPTRISSLLEYEAIFGGAQKHQIKLKDTANGLELEKPTATFLMYHSLQIFFANGGGPCYIVSTGTYGATLAIGDFEDALKSLEKEDEPTLLVFPDVYKTLGETNAYAIYQLALAQANEMGDRFVIMDTLKGDSEKVNNKTTIELFRASGVPADKYGAVYFPHLTTVLNYHFIESSDVAAEKISHVGTEDTTPFNDEKAALLVIKGSSDSLSKKKTAVLKIIAAVNKTIDVKITAALITAVEGANSGNIGDVIGTDTIGVVGHIHNNNVDAIGEASGKKLSDLKGTALYSEIKQLISAMPVVLPPAAAMAGVYARVDSNRGVHKAPANVGLNYVIAPTEKISDAEQEGMNVDATGGKSINAIRTFAGKGTLVWGARTLDGNSNEWRYVPVRRFFNMVEESVQKASSRFVFEPNTANTWVRIQGMIENFLTQQWKAGALAGAKPEEAFYVSVGLGATMSALDVQEGRMIIEIGMAAVRPAEFIVLRFSHKLQEA